MKNKRIQLTLFINENDSEIIESVRKEFNPLQYELIKSHVTLCREDELLSIEKIIENLENLHYPIFTIEFSRPLRFSEGKGIMIPNMGDNEPFQKLREIILKGIIDNPRKPTPHITLMHPRNSTCTDSDFHNIERIQFPTKFVFRKISLIEQEENRRWKILREFELLKT